MKRVRKAVIPAAGMGTRFLPATKVVPKEMLPIVDRPAIEVVVEEILQSGIEEVIFITGRGKGAIIDHFDHSYELEDRLARSGKESLLDLANKAGRMIRSISVRQKEPLGLGHAVLCAQAVVGDEPFAVLLPDDIFRAPIPATRQLLEAREQVGGGVIGLVAIAREDSSKYGVVDGHEVSAGTYKLTRLIEKPAPADAPSTLGVPGRYVLPPRVFHHLERTQRGVGGEIQLTDALDALAREDGLHGRILDAERFDTGDKLGYLKANLAFALDRDDVGPGLRAYAARLLQGNDSGPR